MRKLIWLPEHCEQLRSLRTASGIDISTMAANHSLSKTQVKQLEEGGDSAFYTSEIKFTVGRRLIRSFGVDFLHDEQKEILLASGLSNVIASFPTPQDKSSWMSKARKN